jgi:hypothetical protein
MVKKVGNLIIEYDDASDVLYFSVAAPRHALTEEGPEGLLIRKNPTTDELVGVTVLSYDRHFRHLRDVSWVETVGLTPDLVSYLEERPDFRI